MSNRTPMLSSLDTRVFVHRTYIDKS